MTEWRDLSTGECLIRDMHNSDLSRIVHIEQTAHVSPWARLSFEESMTRGDFCRVLEARDQILAYHVTSRVLDELHILNVVCAPKAQGLGLGHVLMQDILTLAQSARARKLFLEVRESNLVAQALYGKWQFEKIAVRKHYYRPRKPNSERENALVYARQFVT